MQGLTCHNFDHLPSLLMEQLLKFHHADFPPAIDDLHTSPALTAMVRRLFELHVVPRDDFFLLDTMWDVLRRLSFAGLGDFPFEHGRYFRRRLSFVQDSPPVFESLVRESDSCNFGPLLDCLESTKPDDQGRVLKFIPFFPGTLAEDAFLFRRMVLNESGTLNDFTDLNNLNVPFSFQEFKNRVRSRTILTRGLQSEIKLYSKPFLRSWLRPIRLYSPQYVERDIAFDPEHEFPAFSLFNRLCGNTFSAPSIICAYQRDHPSLVKRETHEFFSNWFFDYSHVELVGSNAQWFVPLV